MTRRRRAPLTRAAVVAATSLSLALGLTAFGGSAVAKDDPATDPTVEPVPVPQIKIATFNAGATVKPARSMQDLAKIVALNPDVIALQEFSNWTKRSTVAETLINCEGCVYGGYMPVAAVQGGTPILYRSDRFRLLAAGTQQVTEATFVGKAGAGPSTVRPKYVNWVRLRDLTTKRLIHVFNNHTIASVQGSNGGPNRKFKLRLKVYRKHMKGLQALIQQTTATYKGLVFVTGDLNVNFRRDKVLAPKLFPYTRLGDVGLRASYDLLGQPATGTHVLRSGNASRLIDYVYLKPGKAVTPVAQTILPDVFSDHRPLLVDFEVRPRVKKQPLG